MPRFLFAVVAALSLFVPALVARAQDSSFDVVVYGGTSAGVTAAAQAGRAGKTVALIEPGKHVGGITSSGLGESDVGNISTIGGIAREFYGRIYQFYSSDKNSWQRETRDEFVKRRKGGLNDQLKIQWVFEPRVAEQVFLEMLREAKVTLLLNERLDLSRGVTRSGNRIQSIRLESGRAIAGKVFIDCTYEGDLMSKSGVKYIVGREANSVYDETLNGVRANVSKPYTISPFRVPGDPRSGTLPGIESAPAAAEGSGDGRTQAYNFRFCLTDDPRNQIPITKPDNYDALKYELVARIIARKPDMLPGPSLFKLSAMPNRKTDSNNQGPFSTDLVGASYDWPEAGYAMRDKIWQQHKDYSLGLLWFLGNDPRLPEPLRNEVRKWGLPKDEFTDNGGWPHQLYVREARRMIGEYVVTEHDAMGQRAVSDGVALASYILDSHWVARFVDEQGKLRSEGVYYNKMPAPMPISYRALLPKREECANLLVPVCLSASHVAYGTIRMEPVYMMLGQSAASAAVLAIDSGSAVQDVPYASLREKLISAGQVLSTPAEPAQRQ